jgi:hypothetical protein
MLKFCQERVVRAIGIIGEAVVILYLRVEVLEIDEVKILVTRIVPTLAALIPYRNDPIVTEIILGSERIPVCDRGRKIDVEASQANWCAARGEVARIKSYDRIRIRWEAVDIVRIARSCIEDVFAKQVVACYERRVATSIQ